MSDTSKFKVLIIDDDDIIRDNVRAYLEDINYKVVEAENGAKGLELFNTEQPDAIFVDLRMPEMDGVEFITNVVKINAEIPIIVVSGTGMLQDSIAAVRAGAWDYLIKPITDMEVLEHSLSRALERARLIRENRRHRENLEEEVRARTLELVEKNQQLQREIFERIQAEEYLAKEKEILQTTMHAIDDGVITTTVNGNILFMNEEAEMLCGVSATDTYGKNIKDIFIIADVDSAEKIDPPIAETVEKDITRKIDVASLASKNNSQKLIAATVSPIHEKGTITGTVIVFRDITEKMKSEQEQLKIEKLESLGVLAGGIAHDFNNLLTAIIGELSLLKLKIPPSDDIYPCLLRAELASTRAKDLNMQLLSFSKGYKPSKKIVDIIELIKDTAAFAVRGSATKCVFNFADDIKSVEADPGQIGQALQNLIINAEQAMQRGGKITISASNYCAEENNEELFKPGTYVKITVRDEGSGIPKELIEKVFDPYFTTKKSGSGLGLATSYSVISKHNGYLKLDSTIGVGSIFTIYLPALDKVPESQKKTSDAVIMGSGNILVMDDESMIRQVLKTMLQFIGYNCNTAEDGKETIELYKAAMIAQSPYDAVVIDLTVPGGMGALETIKELHKLDLNVKAIVSTGYANDTIISNYQEFGFKGYILKPFKVDELSRLINAVITGA